MPRIVIAGCGYVGAAAADLFYDAGWDVEGWTASAESAAALRDKRYRVRVCDISDPAAVSAMRAEAHVVIQSVSSRGGGAVEYRRLYLNGAANLLQNFPAATLLFTSSTSVYAQRDGEWVNEESAAEPQRDTARVLRETEELVLARDGIVARVAGIYGPGRSFLLRKVLTGEAVIDPHDDRYINQAHRDDIAAALLLLAQQRERARTAGARAIFNVVDNEPMLASECYRWLSDTLSRPEPPVGKRRSGKRGDSNKRVSNQKLRKIGWRPRFPTFRAGILESVLPAQQTDPV